MSIHRHPKLQLDNDRILSGKKHVSFLKYIVAIVLIVTGAVFFWQQSKIEITVSNIQKQHTESETINYMIEWEKGGDIKTVSFVVKDMPVEKTWEIVGQIYKKQGQFSIFGWHPKIYTYIVTLTDDNNNTHVKKGQFEVIARDIVQPHCSVTGIEPSHREGERISYTIQARDNRKLKAIKFIVDNTDVNKQWEVDASEIIKVGSFSTENWKTNQYYTYVVTAIDEANNHFEKVGSFRLEGTDKELPVGKIEGINQQYYVGDDVKFLVNSSDNESLKNVIFTLEGGLVQQIWHVNGVNNTQQYLFTTKGWQSGEYNYVLKVTDVAGNTALLEGQFLLLEADTSLPVATLSGIRKHYDIGDTLDYEIKATDDTDLDYISFEVHDTNIKKHWEVQGREAQLQSSFSTQDWTAQTYTYSLWIKDKAGNYSEQYQDKFILHSPVEQKIATLLQTCRQHYDANRLTAGQGGTALDCYQNILKLDPNNSNALEGLKKIESRYVAMAKSAMKRKKWRSANIFINRLAKVNPKANDINALKDKLRQEKAKYKTKKVQVKEKKVTHSRPKPKPKPVTRPVKKEESAPAKKVVSKPSSSCKHCNCTDLLTKLSIGLDPLSSQERTFFRKHCK